MRGGQLRDDHDRVLGAAACHHSQNRYRAVQRCRGHRGREFGDLLRRGQQPEMSPEEYLKQNLSSSASGTSLPWLLPLLYVLLALTLVSWAGMRHSNRSRRGRALFVFTLGIVLIVLASAFFFLRAVGTAARRRGAAATLLGCAMLVVAAGSLLPSVEDWFGARYELRTIQPLLTELGRRHPDVGIGVRPRGPLVFRVAERMSLISDALFLEATAPMPRGSDRSTPPARPTRELDDPDDVSELESPSVRPRSRRGRSRSGSTTGERTRRTRRDLPGTWLAAPARHTRIREWILEIARAISPTGDLQEWDGLSDRISQLRRTPQCGVQRANRPGAPGDAARRPSGRCPAGPRRQPDGARRNTANTLVAHIRQPGQFLVELLVVLVVGEVGRLDTEEVGKGCHGGCRGVGAVA